MDNSSFKIFCIFANFFRLTAIKSQHSLAHETKKVTLNDLQAVSKPHLRLLSLDLPWLLEEEPVLCRLRVVPYFSSGIVERAKRERTWKSTHARKGDTRRGERKMNTIPEEKRGTTRSLVLWSFCYPRVSRRVHRTSWVLFRLSTEFSDWLQNSNLTVSTSIACHWECLRILQNLPEFIIILKVILSPFGLFRYNETNSINGT